MALEGYDFSGWASRNNVLCTDGRVIDRNAFQHCDGQTVPLFWNHDPNTMLGAAVLENRPEGMYAYGYLDDSDINENASMASALVHSGTVVDLSIKANALKHNKNHVYYGDILELSVTPRGANPGAKIVELGIAHDEDGTGSEVQIYTWSNEDGLTLEHSDEPKEEEVKMARTNQEIFDSMDDEQKALFEGAWDQAFNAGYEAAEEAIDDETEEESEGGDEEMAHSNVFDEQTYGAGYTLTHSDFNETLMRAREGRVSSLKDVWEAYVEDQMLQHSDMGVQTGQIGSNTYGIADMDWLLPEVKNLNNPPAIINRRTEWVDRIIKGTHHTPFSRIKSQFADIRHDEARAKGYVKGNRKTEEVISLLRRTTTPTTIYKKQKLDRDDIIDITDFSVVQFIRAEMRVKLDEEIARAILLGDGRLASDQDKISESNIRPIWKDDALFNIKLDMASEVTKFARSTDDNGGQYQDWSNPKAIIRSLIAARKDYRGSGQPECFMAQSLLTELLLIEDNNGRAIYETPQALATKLQVSAITPVEYMDEMLNSMNETGQEAPVAIIVNLQDYNVGADQGGAINMFDDFDIDFNQYKYLMETRCSGALIKPFAAISMVKSYAA